MNLLPIARRELRVAARKRSTFWLRVAAAVTGLVLGSGCMLMAHWQRNGTAQMGSVLFHVLTWTCLAAGLSAGLFFTSDCLSEEKREGTLGLLFLTDLRGYDVGLGKLLATSLRGFYALLAVLPILAITELMGGVTGAQYWKGSLALLNALFCSLAAGMLISSISRDSQKALGATLLLLLLIALGGPVADLIIAGLKQRGFQPVWSLSSPGYVLVSASAWGRAPYWDALLITQVVGWGLLALACLLVPHTWQQSKSADLGSSRGWGFSWKYGGARRRASLRRKLLERQPMAWLACRERWQSLVLWTMALLATGGLVWALSGRPEMEVWIIWNYLGGFLSLVLYLWAASQACRVLVEARRSGLMESVLVAPVSERDIVRGRWRAFRRMFGFPVLLLLGVGVAGAALSQLGWQRMAGQVGPITSSAITNQGGLGTNQTTFVFSTTVSVSGQGLTNSGSNRTTSVAPARRALVPEDRTRQVAMTVAAAAAAALSTAANLMALCWFGMWMGMTSRTANLATLKTIAFVQVIPWFAITFGTTMLFGLIMAGIGFVTTSQSPSWFAWWPLLSTLLGAGLAVAKDIGFIVWSRRRLYSSFRAQATQGIGGIRFVAP